MSDKKELKLAPEVEAAFAALDKYENGSNRAALLPLESEILQKPADKAQRERMEQRLLAVLTGKGSAPAKQFACNMLALVGTDRSARPLAQMLHDSKVAADARTALEAIPHPAASRAMLREMPKLAGREKAGAIASIAAKGYTRATRMIERELKDKDSDVQRAATLALKELKRA